MQNKIIVNRFLVIYLSFLFLATFFIIPTLTSLYYYAWGKQLAWSYFDGPPMIAYFFYTSHAIFGNTFFSINIVGFFCLVTGAYYLYKTGCLLQNHRTGLMSALIWMALPTTTESVFNRVVYDAPLNLFTILTFYYFARYLSLQTPRKQSAQQHRIPDQGSILQSSDASNSGLGGVKKESAYFDGCIDLYLSALFMGAMVLSKFTAAVSVSAIILYIIFSKQRQLFKNKHFYLSGLLVLIMAFPILYWNAQHDWISIRYLLHFHSQSHASVIHCLIKLFLVLLINYSVFLWLSWMGFIRYRQSKHALHETNLVLEFIFATLGISLVFWVVVTLLGGAARTIYLVPLGINIALIAGYTITRYQYNRFIRIFYPIFLILSIGTIVANSWPIATYFKKGLNYAVLTHALKQPGLIKTGQPIVTGSYISAAKLSFFMPTQSIYTLPCGDSNQYHYWSQSFLTDLYHGKVDKISYIDFEDTKQCPEQFFSQCQKVVKLPYTKIIPVIHKLTKPVYLFVYECSLPRRNAYYLHHPPAYHE